MSSSLSHRNLTHLGMDVHKDSISIGILRPDEESPDVERIFNDEPSIRRFLARFDEPRRLSTCYEAGPTGYELHRLLTTMNIRCQVIAPSLIPKAAGRPGQDRQAGLPQAGPPPPGRRARRHPGADPGGGGGAGPVPSPGRHGRGPRPGPQAPGGVPAAPRRGVAGRLGVDPQARGVAAGRATSRTRRWPPPSATTGPWWRIAPPPSTPSKPTWCRASTGSRSPTPSAACRPTGAWPAWER